MTHWLFQGNPKYYRLIEGIRNFEQMLWPTTRYAEDMYPGDGVLIWKSGDKAGIYAIAEIVEAPRIVTTPDDINYWRDKFKDEAYNKLCATIRFTSKLLEAPMLRENLKKDLELQNLTVIRQPNGTNYKITPMQWRRVYELRGNK